MFASNTWLNFGMNFIFSGSTATPPLHVSPLHEQQLLFIVDDLCRFILHEVVHIGGEFVHPEHELSLDPKYASLRQWENQELRASSSSVSQCK